MEIRIWVKNSASGFLKFESFQTESCQVGEQQVWALEKCGVLFASISGLQERNARSILITLS